MIAMAGILVRNSILLVSFIELKLQGGTQLEDAVCRAAALRLRILHTLARKEQSVQEIRGQIRSAQPNGSKHLAVLSRSGIVSACRAGARVRYLLADAAAFSICPSGYRGLERELATASQSRREAQWAASSTPRCGALRRSSLREPFPGFDPFPQDRSSSSCLAPDLENRSSAPRQSEEPIPRVAVSSPVHEKPIRASLATWKTSAEAHETLVGMLEERGIPSKQSKLRDSSPNSGCAAGAGARNSPESAFQPLIPDPVWPSAPCNETVTAAGMKGSAPSRSRFFYRNL